MTNLTSFNRNLLASRSRGLTQAIVVASIAAVAPLISGFSAPAQAGCSTTTKFVSDAPGSSDTFSAHSGCDGVWGVQWVNAVGNKYAMGQYKKGGWQNSSYGFQIVPTASPGHVKLIGNTIDGRLCRVVAQSGASSMYVDF